MPQAKKGARAPAGENEDITQALVLADSFDTRFTPISTEVPRALMPLVNTPMLNYTIEFLASSGMTSIHVLACSHADMIEEHVQKTFRFLPNVKVECIKVDPGECPTAGQALRVVFEENIFTEDFVLVSGDVISNVSLRPILKLHQERRKKDKSIVMTTLLMQASPHHRSRAQEDATVVAVDSQTGELLQYDNSPETRKVKVSAELFRTHPTMEVRYDLLDCRVDICSAQVLQMVVSEFHEDLRCDWMHGVLNNEVIQSKIWTHVIKSGYMNRCRNLNTYIALSSDILHRWTYPMVPDNNWLNDSTYSHTRPLIYKEENIRLARSCQVEKGSAIGAGCTVGKHSVIASSVIGRNCTIGNSVRIINSFLWDGAVVEDHSTVTNSIVCSNAVVKQNTHIGIGSVVSFGVVVGPDISLPPGTKLTMIRVDETTRDSWSVDNDEQISTEEIDLGVEGRGFKWVIQDDNPLHKLYPVRDVFEDDGDFDDDESEASEDEAEPVTNLQLFMQSIGTIMAEGLEGRVTKEKIENMSFEIGSARMAYDRSYVECVSAIIPYIFELVTDGNEGNIAKLQAKLKLVLPKWAPLFAKLVFREEDQVELIFSLQEYCENEENPSMGITAVFQDVLFILYNEDVIEEEAVMTWAGEQAEDDRTFVDKCHKFIQWLQEAEEDEDSE